MYITLKWKPEDLLVTDKSALIGNGLMQSSNKQLPEPVLTMFSNATWRH